MIMVIDGNDDDHEHDALDMDDGQMNDMNDKVDNAYDVIQRWDRVESWQKAAAWEGSLLQGFNSNILNI